MIREHLYHKKIGADHDFRWRGGDVTRLEGIADGVFAITLTLLIVTGSGVTGFNEVWTMVRDLPAFLASFALIMYIWLEHYKFFRRYGLIDAWSIFFNAAFLFIVMILAYPLKLLSTFLWYLIIGVSTEPLFVTTENSMEAIAPIMQRQYMMYFYGTVIIGVFGILMLMHVNAWGKRQLLELDELEKLTTLQAITHHGFSTLVGLLSIIVLWFSKNPGLSGVVYFLMPILHPFIAFIFIKKINSRKRD